MKSLLCALLMIAAAGCSSTTTFGAGDGTIPARPPSATYPNWEHYCVAVSAGPGFEESVTRQLQNSGQQGWELVSMSAVENSAVLFCFKRPVAVGAAPATAPATSPPAAAQP